MKPKLVVDFDDVCVDFMRAWQVFHAKTWSAPLIAYENIWTFDLDKLHGITVQEKNDRIRDFWNSPDHDLIEASPDAFAGLVVLGERFELHMATARSEEVKPQTMRLVERYFADVFADMHFTGYYHNEEGKRVTKAAICECLEAVGLIDDVFHNLMGLVGEPWGRLLVMPDRPWNQDKHHQGIVRTFGWAHIMSVLNAE